MQPSESKSELARDGGAYKSVESNPLIMRYEPESKNPFDICNIDDDPLVRAVKLEHMSPAPHLRSKSVTPLSRSRELREQLLTSPVHGL